MLELGTRGVDGERRHRVGQLLEGARARVNERIDPLKATGFGVVALERQDHLSEARRRVSKSVEEQDVRICERRDFTVHSLAFTFRTNFN